MIKSPYYFACLLTEFVFVCTTAAVAQADKSDQSNALIEICDGSSASPLDEKRPPGVVGVASDRVDAAVAIPACEAAVKARPSDARLIFQLGRAYWAGKKFDLARIQYQNADALSYGLATNNLAAMFVEDGGLNRDYSTYRTLLTRASELNVAISQYNMGLNYLRGTKGFEKNFAEARKWLKLAADAKFLLALPELAIMLRDGEGGPPDRDQAKQLFFAAAKEGNTFSKHNYALMLQNEKNSANRAEARHWYYEAAIGGNKYAMNQIGYYYAMGWGGPKNLADARSWFAKGAEAGNEMSMHNLAIYLKNGMGGPRDQQSARDWLKKSSLAGYADASLDLGVMYVMGQGGPRDVERGRAMYEKAIEQGERKYARSNIAKIDAWYAAKRQSAQRQRQQRYVSRRGENGYRSSGGGGGGYSYQPPSCPGGYPVGNMCHYPNHTTPPIPACVGGCPN